MPAPSSLSHIHNNSSEGQVKPRIIIHGGAGNITRVNLPPELWKSYQAALLRILRSIAALLLDPSPLQFATHQKKGTDALTAAVHAVQQLEDDPLFNAGVGAVFNREGRVELEAGVMVSSGRWKRGVGVSGIQHVRSPVGLAAEVLRRGDELDGGGAQGHVQLNGPYVEGLAREWGCEMCEESVFYTRKRWEEHKRGLEDMNVTWDGLDLCSRLGDSDGALDPMQRDHEWDGREYLPQGTVGCVVLDRYGTLAVATSTGGMTNKLPGRIGDTPTLGAGLWAEEWQDSDDGDISHAQIQSKQPAARIPEWTAHVVRNLVSLDPSGIIRNCLPLPLYLPKSPLTEAYRDEKTSRPKDTRHAVAMGGTGNGDSFLRLCAVRTVAARVRFSPMPLVDAVAWMAGPGGELQRSVERTTLVTGEGEGGIIGIELKEGQGTVVANFNKAMFRAWIDDDGHENCMVFREDY